MGEEANYPASSHFGSGILTWNLPFHFRTPKGHNLQVRGPANWPKGGAYPLERTVETEWTVSSFTMDWKLTRAELPVVFEADEPICMIVPQRRGELEGFHPEIRELDEEPQTASAYRQWADKRGKFNQELKVPGSEAVKRSWQRDYVLGTVPGGFRAEEHQTKPGPLTRLLSSHEQPPAFAGRTFRTDAHSPRPVSGDDHPPYNKRKALRDCLREAPPEEEAVLILDPDCIFLKPFTGSVSRGHPIAQPISYLNPAHEHKREIVRKHCRYPGSVQGVGIPILIDRDDLATVARCDSRRPKSSGGIRKAVS